MEKTLVVKIKIEKQQEEYIDSLLEAIRNISITTDVELLETYED